jgi:Flp pilus assembly protein TadG
MRAILKRKFDAWAQNRRGSAAVEFALVAFPFMMILFGILEVAMMFFVSTTLESAVSTAAREIRTGRLQATAGTPADNFRTMICNRSFGMLDCTGRLYFDVRVAPDFNDPSADPLADGVLNASEFNFNAGNAGDIVIVRAFYDWQVFTPLMGNMIANTPDRQRRVLMAAFAFRNEPFGTP